MRVKLDDHTNPNGPQRWEVLADDDGDGWVRLAMFYDLSDAYRYGQFLGDRFPQIWKKGHNLVPRVLKFMDGVADQMRAATTAQASEGG